MMKFLYQLKRYVPLEILDVLLASLSAEANPFIAVAVRNNRVIVIPDSRRVILYYLLFEEYNA